MTNLREQIADVQHQIWAHWMKYMFTQCETAEDAETGDTVYIIPADKIERWTRQMNTDYSELTNKEQESDRDQADKVLSIVFSGRR